MSRRCRPTCRLVAAAALSSQPLRVSSTPRTTLVTEVLMVAMKALFTSSPSCVHAGFVWQAEEAGS